MAGEIIDLSELDAVDILSGARVYSSARVPRLEPNIKGVYVTQYTDGDCQVFAGNGRENLRIRRETGSIRPGSARLKSENRAGMTLITFALETTMKPTNSLAYREPSDFIRWKVEAKGVTDVFSALTHLAFRKILCSKSKEELMPRQPRLSRPGFPHSSNARTLMQRNRCPGTANSRMPPRPIRRIWQSWNTLAIPALMVFRSASGYEAEVIAGRRWAKISQRVRALLMRSLMVGSLARDTALIS